MNIIRNYISYFIIGFSLFILTSQVTSDPLKSDEIEGLQNNILILKTVLPLIDTTITSWQKTTYKKDYYTHDAIRIEITRDAFEFKFSNGCIKYDAQTRNIVNLLINNPVDRDGKVLSKDEIAKIAKDVISLIVGFSPQQKDIMLGKMMIQEYDKQWLYWQCFIWSKYQYYNNTLSAYFDQSGRLLKLHVSWPIQEADINNKVNITKEKAISIVTEDAVKSFGRLDPDGKAKGKNTEELGVMDVAVKGKDGNYLIERRFVWRITLKLYPPNPELFADNRLPVVYMIDAETSKIINKYD